MSNALYIKTATKKPLTSGLNVFVSRKSGGYCLLRAKNALRFADMSQHFFCGIARAKDAAYNHFKVYDVCSFHSG